VAWSRTTYLDTDDLLYFRSSHGPVVQRLRVREYGAAADVTSAPAFDGPSVLELKTTRSGSRRRKVRWWTDAATIERALSGDPPATCPTPLVRHLARPLRPRVMTLYRRLAFVGEEPFGIRITVDLDLRFVRPDGEVLAQHEEAIVEAKIMGKEPGWLVDFLAAVGSAQPISKFRTGMLLLAPEAPHTYAGA